MSQETKGKELTSAQNAASVLVAEDVLTDDEIAARVNITRRTLDRWKQLPGFAENVKSVRSAFGERATSEGIGRVDVRVAGLNDRYRRLRRVMAERAEEMAGMCAGASTGLMTRKVVFVKVFEPGKETQKRLDAGIITIDEVSPDDLTATRQTRAVEEFAIDTGLLAELRALEMQAAKELGQWVDKSDTKVSGAIKVEQEYDLTGLSEDQLTNLEAILTAAATTKEASGD